MALSVTEFSAKIKDKYPQYRDVDDLELTNRIIEKYPEYKDQVMFPSGELSEVSSQGSEVTSGISGMQSNNSADPSLVIDVTGINTQVNPDGTFITEIDVENGDIQASLNPDTNPDFLTSVRNTAYNTANRLKGAIPRLNVVASDVFSNIFGEEVARKIYENDPIRNLFGDERSLEEIRNGAYQTLSALNLEQRETQGIVENIESAQYGNLPAAAVDAIGSLISTAIPAFATGGAGLYTEMVGDAIVTYNEEKAKRLNLTVPELYEQGKAEIGTPLVLGTISGALEQIGIKGVQSAMTRKLSGTAARKIATFIGDANVEGTQEFLQLGVEELNRQLGQGKSTEEAGEAALDLMFSKQGLESYLMGVVASGSAGAIGQLTKRLVSNEARETVSQEETKIVNLQESLNNANLNPNTRQILEAELTQSQNNIINATLNDLDVSTNLSPQQETRVEDLLSQLESVQAAINDPSLSEEGKRSLQPRLSELSTEIDNILNQQEQQESNVESGSALEGNIYTDGSGETFTISIMDGPNGEVDSVNDIQNRERLGLVVRNSNGETVGNATFWQDDDGRFYSNLTNVRENYRRRGIATAMYDFARQNGYDIKSSDTRTEMGNSFTNSYFNQNQEFTPDSREGVTYVGQTGTGQNTNEDSQQEVLSNLIDNGFTEEESNSFIQDIATEEGRSRRLNDAASRIRETWSRLSQQGIADNPEQRNQDVARLIRDVTEYAAVAIVDGTIRTARQLADNLGIDLDENVQRAFDTAREISTRLNRAIPRQQQPRVNVSTRSSIDQTVEGRIQGSTTISNRQALRDQIRTLNRGIRMGMQNQVETQRQKDARIREVKENITRMINSFNNTDLFKGATVPANLVPRLVRRLNNAKTETALFNFSEYLEKLVDDIDYDNKVRQASSNSNRVSRLERSGNLKSQTTLKPLLKRLADIGKRPTLITDLDEYNRIAQQVIDRQGNIGLSNVELEAYLNNETRAQQAEASKRETELNEARKEAELERIQNLIDEYGLDGTAEDYWEAIKAHEDSNTLVDLRPERVERDNLTEQLVKMIEANRQGLPSNNQGLNGYESDVLEALKKTKLDNLTNVELRQLNTAISNAVVNGDYVTGTLDIVGRYKATQEATTWTTDFKDKLNTIIDGAGRRWDLFGFRLTPQRNKLDTNQLFRSMSSVREVGESLYGYVMGNVDRGVSRAKQIIDRSVKTAISIYDKNKLKAQDSFDVGTALYLLNYETDGWWTSPQEAFEVKKSRIAQSIERLERNLEERRGLIYRADRRRYEKEIKHLKATLAKANRFYLVENFQDGFLSKGQKELYDHIIATWKSQEEASRAHFRKLGVKFTESELYAPISYNRIITSKVTPEMDFGIDTYYRAGAIDNEGKFVAERQNLTQLPVRKTGTGQQIEFYLNLDAIKNFDRELSRRLFDIETIDARVKAKYLLSNETIKEAIGTVNHENIVWKTELNIKDLSGVSGFINDPDEQLDNILNSATRLFYQGAVGSFTQVISQSVPNIPSVIANTSVGSWSQSVKLMGKLKATQIFELIKNADASAYLRLNSQYEDRMMNTLSDMESETESNLSRGLSRVNKKVAEFVYEGLKFGDNTNTINSWMAGYIESLKKQGIISKSSEFTSQMLEDHILNPNKEAAQFADGIASSVNATVRKASRAEIVKNRSTYQRIFNSLLGNPLKSFAISQNMEAKLAFRNIMRNEYTGKDIALISAYIGNVFILANMVRFTWSYIFQGAGGALAGLILGDDEEEKAEERRLKDLGLTKEEEFKIKTNRKIVSMLAQGIGSVLFGSQPLWIEQSATAAIDQAYTKLIVPNFNKGRNKKDQARDPLPSTLFFTSSDNVFGVGVADNYAQLFNSVDRLSTDPLPLDEEAARKLQSLRLVTAVAEVGILGADFKRIAQQTLYSMEKSVKDGYYKMSNSYGVIKEAVNRYGIKPLAPFNTSQLYLENNEGEIKPFVLSDNEIVEINREIGKEMVNLLPEYGYSKSINNFNKEGYSVEDINSDMSDIKSEAKKIVLERRFKGYYISSRQKYNSQQEEEE